MDLDKRLSISYYQVIGTINETRQIYIVQHQITQKIFIKKVLGVYNKAIYEYLLHNPIMHTPKIYEVFEEDNTLTIIEEYISGYTLDELLDRNIPFSAEKIKHIVIQLCKILSEFHACNPSIIHRDIKPSNVIITPSNEVYLLDFNAAKYHNENQSEDTTLLGTKGYAAPEQYGFGASNIQTDIYALGMLINTLVNGSFSPTICEGHELTPVVKKCTKLNPSERYKNVDYIAKILSSDGDMTTTSNTDISWTKYLPPGFRSLQPLNMFVSFVTYVLVFWISLTLELKDTTSIISLYIQRFFCLIIFLAIILCTCNYLDLQILFPPCKTKNKVLKFLSVILLDFIITTLLLVVMVIIITMAT